MNITPKRLFLISLISILIVIGFVIAGVVSRSDSEESIDSAILIPLSDSRQTLYHPAFQASFKLPDDWFVQIDEEGRGLVKGHLNVDTVDMQLTLDRFENEGDKSVHEIIEEEGGLFEHEIIQKNNFEGIESINQFVEEEIHEHDSDDPNEEIFVGEIDSQIEFSRFKSHRFLIKGDIIEITCRVTGFDYVVWSMECDEIIESLHIGPGLDNETTEYLNYLENNPLSEFIPFITSDFSIDYSHTDKITNKDTYRVYAPIEYEKRTVKYAERFADLQSSVRNWITERGIDPNEVNLEFITDPTAIPRNIEIKSREIEFIR